MCQKIYLAINLLSELNLLVLFIFKRGSVPYKKIIRLRMCFAEGGREESICERLETNRWGRLTHCAVYNYLLIFLAHIFTIRMTENKTGISLLKGYKCPETVVDIVSKYEKANITKLNRQTDRLVLLKLLCSKNT